VYCDQICNGLAYMDMSKPIDVDFSSLPHVVLPSDSSWNTTVLASEFNPDVDWQDAQEEDFFDHILMTLGVIFTIMLLSLKL